jgi:hypothetical protein
MMILKRANYLQGGMGRDYKITCSVAWMKESRGSEEN